MKAEARTTNASTRPTGRETGTQVNMAVFEWTISLFSVWMIAGVHLDAWAHHHIHLESFFTPWHGVLYSGYLAAAATLLFVFVRNVRAGAAWRQALPAGYGLSLVGAGIFLAGGFGDMLWHTLFGIEVNLEALLSPTHLILALGGTLIVTGPLRAAMQRRRAADRQARAAGTVHPGWPALISLTLLFAILVFFSAYAHPLIDGGDNAYGNSSRGLTVAGILLQSGLLMGAVLFALRRWRLPAGSLILIVGLSSLMALGIRQAWIFLPGALIAALAGELMLAWLKPSPIYSPAVRWFGFGLPAVFWALYFATRALTEPFNWTIHLWAGSILLAGIMGLLVSYTYFPPEVDL
jgi:hypothetical protein